MNIRKLMYLSQINNSYGEQLKLYGNCFHKNVKDMLSSEDIELFRTNAFFHDWKINKEFLQYVDEAFPTLVIEIGHGKEQTTTFLFSNVLVYEKKMRLGSNFVSHMEDIIDCFVGKKKKRICCGFVLASGTRIYIEAKHLALKNTSITE